ncbi:MAG: DNA mismatch endonuclease Vsr [Pseudomonadota bacterium]
MPDVFTKAKRSEVMSRIKGRDTQPERAVRSMLHRMGYRFRLHKTDLPGKPDIVLTRYGTVIFVHGCFWHRHKGCRFAYVPKSRQKFWQTKFESNVKRDRKVRGRLRKLGWHVIVVWECALRSPSRLWKRLEAALSERTGYAE